MNEVEKAYRALSKNARQWFADFEFCTRSGDHLRDFLAHHPEEEFNRRFEELPRPQRAHLQILMQARLRQVQQAKAEAREIQDLALDWMNEA